LGLSQSSIHADFFRKLKDIQLPDIYIKREMIKKKSTDKPTINKDIEINLDNELKTNNETIDPAKINMSREILNDFLKGKNDGNRIKLTSTFISFQLFINDIIEKSKTKPNNNPSGSYGDPIIKQTKK
jgi:hypothetical protein